MDIGLLNEKVTFQKNVVSVDAIGNHRNVWEDFYSCFATIGGESGMGAKEKRVSFYTINTDRGSEFKVFWLKR